MKKRHALRDPLPGHDLPRCICGEEVAVPHKSCLALMDDGSPINERGTE